MAVAYPFQIIIISFIGVILLGTLLLALPISSYAGQWTSFEDALFTATSAVCVTGLIVQDTALYWSYFGQAVILIMIQIGGIGVISIVAFIAAASGRKISLLQRSTLQGSISAHEIGGVVGTLGFIFKGAFIIELAGALLLLPVFCSHFGPSGIWTAVFHSVSAFCNAGFDIMGIRSGSFTSLTAFGSNIWVIIVISLLIIIGGIGFLTWDDIAVHKIHFKKYRMQTKVILTTSALLILIPAILFFFIDFSDYPIKERICLSLFQSVTARTAGFNTADYNAMTGSGRLIMIILMLIGGSPGSTAGGMKTTTFTVLLANAFAVFRRKKDVEIFGRRLEDGVIRSAATLLLLYIFLTFIAAAILSIADHLALATCLFETASAIGTVGLSLGITPALGTVSHVVLILLMFFGRVGGLTLIYATVSNKDANVSQSPVEKIIVG